MRITKELCPGAIKPEHREGPIKIDFEGSTVIGTHGRYALFVESTVKGVALRDGLFYVRPQGNRLMRFIRLIPYIWRASK